MRFAVIGSAHAHIYEFIEDMLKLGSNFVTILNDGTDECLLIAQKYKVSLTSTIEEIFDQNIDIVGSAAVNCERINIIGACSTKGVHIIADKPIVTNDEHYIQLEKIMNKGNIEIGMMLPLRYIPQIVCIKELIDTCRIGNLISIQIFNPHKLIASQRPSWFFEKSRSGGIVNDLLIHSIDLYNWLSYGEIVEYSGYVKKSTVKEKEDFFDSVEFLIRSSSGISGYFRTDMHMTYSHWNWGDLRVFCTGTKGMIEARVLGDPITKTPSVILYEQGHPTKEIDCKVQSNSAVIDFVERINKRQSIVGHDDILKASNLALEFDRVAKRIII